MSALGAVALCLELGINLDAGRDVSWIWDADFEQLAAQVRRVTCSGTRAAELALRLKCAGLPTDRLQVAPSLRDAFARALADTAEGRLFVLPTYTALLELHDELASHGHVLQFWQDEKDGRR